MLPLLLLTACFHKNHQAQNVPLAPPIQNVPPPNTTPVELSPSATTIPTQPTQNAKEEPEPEPKPRVRRHRSAPVDKTPVDEAANETPGVSAVGQLSSGDPADYRLETEDTIASTERGLKSINRPLNDQEQKTADHIREFLKEAREALASGDVDGAHTLAAKAKVLLAELTQ